MQVGHAIQCARVVFLRPKLESSSHKCVLQSLFKMPAYLETLVFFGARVKSIPSSSFKDVLRLRMTYLGHPVL